MRPGGVWKHTMHGPDGTDYPNKSVFIEVVKPERIVFKHGGSKEGGPGPLFKRPGHSKSRATRPGSRCDRCSRPPPIATE